MKFNQLLTNTYFKDPLIILRIWLGIAFIMHGLPGVFNSDYMAGHAGFMESIEIPMPYLMAYLSKGGELLAGVFLLLGLFTKPAALFVIINMLVATFFAMRGDIFGDFQAEISFTYLLMALALFLARPTGFSMDQRLWKVA